MNHLVFPSVLILADSLQHILSGGTLIMVEVRIVADSVPLTLTHVIFLFILTSIVYELQLS